MIKTLVIIYCLTLLICTEALAIVPAITTIANTSSVVGATYTVIPALSNAATGVTWTKEFGPDDMTVNSSTGAVSWIIPSTLPQEAFHLGVRASNSDGHVYTTWILKVGGGNFIYVGPSDTYHTISAGNAAAASGDTIVVRDGTYTGISNMMINTNDQGTIPPSGSATGNGVYTTVMAEHPGGALIDGQGTNTPISLQGNYTSRDQSSPSTYNCSYIAIKGFVAGRSSSDTIGANHVHHVKVIDCGAFDSVILDSGGTLQFSRSNYILFEGDYTWGNGRYGINLYICDNSVVRRCVARVDRTNAQEPLGGIFHYAGQNGVTQNSIVVDSDQAMFYRHEFDAGAISASSGGDAGNSWAATKNILMSDNIALNVWFNALTNTYDSSGLSTTTSFVNSIFYDMHAQDDDTWGNPSGISTDGSDGIFVTPASVTFNQLTVGKFRTQKEEVFGGGYFNGYNSHGSTNTITNSIITDLKMLDGVTGNDVFYSWASNYNNIFDTGTINVPSTGGSNTSTITTNPTTSCLKYLPRIESGCSLQTAGVSGAQVGAQVLTMRGKSGTLYGDTNYDTDNAYPMWPYPHEDLIKSQMQNYSYTGLEYDMATTGTVTGNRGFASTTAKQLNGLPVTLTSYIWEYLGNPIPTAIYGQTVFNGNCGPANGQAFTSLTSGNSTLCAPGTVVSFVSGSNGWTWGCNSTTGGSNTTATACSAILDTTPPKITSFTLPSSSVSLTVPISTFTATDNVAVANYCVTTTNSSSGCLWSTVAPTSITFTANGYNTAYAWAQDTAGNISPSVSASILLNVGFIGNTVALTGADSSNVGALVATQFTATQTGTIQSISTIASGGTGHVMYALYSDSSGKPGTLQANSNAITLSGANTYTGALTVVSGGSLTITSGSKYWLAFLTDDNGYTLDATITSGGTSTYMSKTYASGFPTTFTYTAGNNFTTGYSMYGTLTVSITPDNTPPVTTFVLPSSSTITSIPVTTFSATDIGGSGVVGYCTTTTNNSLGCAGQWLGTAPTTVTGVSGSNTFYGWTIDAANNISSSVLQTITVTTSSINGVCGIAANGTTSTIPTVNLCGDGSTPLVTLNGSTYSWTCLGSGGGSNANCTSTYQASIINPMARINAGIGKITGTLR